MIGIDTNILLQYLVQDDPVQSAMATAMFEQTLTAGNPGFISIVTIAETVWVLSRAYRSGDKRIAAAIKGMLQADHQVVENEQAVLTAMIALRDGRGAFAEVLIGALGRAAGCEYAVTFDKKAGRLAGFRPFAG